MAKSTPTLPDGQAPPRRRSRPPRRRDGDRDYAIAFAWAGWAILRGREDHGARLIVEEVATTTLTSAVRRPVTQAATQAQGALDALLYLFDFRDDRATPPELPEAALRLLEDRGCHATVALLRERDRGPSAPLDVAAVCQFLEADLERLASFTSALAFLERRGGGIGEIAPFVATELVRAQWEGVLAAMVHDPTSTLLALEAFHEAAAVWDGVLGVRRTRVALARWFFRYYVARRTGIPDLLSDARRQAEYATGESGHPDGPVYLRGWKQYENLDPDDPTLEPAERERNRNNREIAASAYCKEFLRVLDDLAVEALFCPGVAIRYAGRAGERVANRTLQPRLARRDRDVEMSATDESDDEELWVESDDEELWEDLRRLPGGDLAEGRYRYCVRPARLAAGRGIPRETVRRQLSKFLDAYRDYIATGVVRGKRSKLDEAIDMLLEVLEDGPQPAERVRAEADRRGIAWRTVERAKGRDEGLGILSEKRGFDGGWVWALPPRSP